VNRSKIAFALLGIKHGFNMNDMVRFVNENQYWSHDKIMEYQVSHLRNLLEHAYKHTRYYRKVMDERGIRASDVTDLTVLKKLPVIGKQEINQCWQDFVADNAKQYHPMHRVTSGTTGLTFKYLNDAKSWGLNWATKERTFSWGGYTFGKDKIATLKGGSMLRRAKPSLSGRFWKYLHNYHDLSVVHLSEANMEQYYREMIDLNIKFLRGFPTAVYTFAKYIAAKHGSLPLKATFTSAEYLQDFQRELIKETFRTNHIDAYGCGDGMGGANQCEQAKGYHINIETSIMEIISANGSDCMPGEEGEIVLTSLHDYAMPLIRYTPGDVAKVASEQCPCGRSLPLLERIVGRTSDLIDLPNGRSLNGIAVPFAEWADKIEKFQLWHTQPDEVILKVIPKVGLMKQDIDHITEIMEHHLGHEIRFAVDLVDDIPLSESGKFRYVVSKINRT